MQLKLQRQGENYALIIPKSIVEQANLEIGSELEIKVTTKGIELTPKSNEPTLDELMKQITPENQHKEMNFNK